MGKEQKIRRGFRPVEPWQLIQNPNHSSGIGAFDLGPNSKVIFKNPSLNTERPEVRSQKKPTGKNKGKFKRRR